MANLFIVSAPSGCGKTSLLKALVANIANLQVCISHTTRAKRADEIDGKNYFFVSQNQFDEIKNNQGFVEYAKVFDFYYGSSKQNVQDLLNQNQDVILEIDWQGAKQVRKSLPKTISIFILPPSNDALKQRLKSRNQDSAAIIKRRIDAAKNEMQHFNEYDYLLINDDFDSALNHLKIIIQSSRLQLTPQTQRHQNLLKQLL